MNNSNQLHRGRIILILLFLLSGAAGLIYQVIWFKKLTYFIGNTTPAQSILLATYMGGLAIGAYVWGKRSVRKKALLSFAYLELFIGIYCIFFPWLFNITESIFVEIVMSSGLNSDSTIVFFLRFILSVILILPPTILMGGTLPLLVSHLSSKMTDVLKNVSVLYFLNSLGAVLGTLFCGFYLLETIGLQSSLIVGVVLDIIVAGWAIYLYYTTQEVNVEKTSEKSGESESQFSLTARQHKVVIWLAGISGFTAMAYEIIWLRLLIPVLSSTTYSFTIVLSIFILGITIGSFLVYKFSSRIKNSYRFLGLIQLGILLSIIAGLPLYERLPYFIWNAIGDPNIDHHSYGYYIFIQLFFVFLILIVPTILMGMSLPIASRLSVNKVEESGSGVGKIFSINTLGTVTGSLITGLALIPWIGLFSTLLVILLMNLILSLRILLEKEVLSKSKKIIVVGVSLLICLLSISSTSQSKWIYTIFLSETPRKINRMPPPNSYSEFLEKSQYHDSLLFVLEGPNGIFIVGENDGDRYLFTNGKGDASTVGDLRTQVSLGLTPVILHENPKDVMVIGFGAGTTIGHVLGHPSVKHAVVAEISKEVLKASAHFSSINLSPLKRSNLEVISDDGISALRLSSRKYDVIISQPSNPWSSGVGNLFTTEFFQSCKEKLNPGGIVAQWFNLYEMDDKSLKLILRTALSEFKHITLWQIGRADILLICSREKLNLELDALKRRYELSSELLQKIGIHDYSAFLSQQILSEQSVLKQFVGEGPLNTEDLPLLEHWAPKAYYYNSSPQEFYPLDERPHMMNHKQLLLTKYALKHNGLTNNEKMQIALFQSLGGNKQFAYGLAEENPEIYLAWAKKAEQAGNLAKKQEFESLALRAQINNDTVGQNEHLNKSILLAQENNLNGALDEINLALQEDNSVPEYHFRKGLYLDRMGQITDAIKSYEKALSLDHKYGDCYINLAIIYGKQRELAKAIATLNEAEKHLPNDPKVYFNRGNAKGLAGDINGAISDLNKTIKLSPNHHQAYLLRGTAYVQTGNKAQACQDFKKAQSLGNPNAQKYLTNYCN